MGSPLMAIALGALSGVNSNREAARAAAREQRQQDLFLRRQQGEDFDRAARLYGPEAFVDEDDDGADAMDAAASGPPTLPSITPGGVRSPAAGRSKLGRGPALVATPKSATPSSAAPAASFAASFDDADEPGTTQQGVAQPSGAQASARTPVPKTGNAVLDEALRVTMGGHSYRVDPSRSVRARQEVARQAHDVANREAAAALRTADPDAWGASYDPEFDYRKAHQQVIQETSNVKSLVASGYAKTEDEARLLIRKGIDVQDRRDKREAAKLAREAHGVQASKEQRERTDWSAKRKQEEVSGAATAWAEGGHTVEEITAGIAKFYPDLPFGLRAGIAAQAVQDSRKAKSPAQPERPRASTRRPAATRPAAAGGAGTTTLPPLNDAQLARAKTDPLYAQFLRSKGYK